MNTEHEAIARLIQDHVRHEATAKQLRRLPLFAVPGDTEDAFSHLLDRLDMGPRIFGKRSSPAREVAG